MRGNPGRRKLNAREPKPKAGFPACPDHLQGAVREAWERFAEELTRCGVGTRVDAVALELLSNAYAAYQQAQAYVEQTGPVWIGEKEAGNKFPSFAFSPFWSVRNNEFEKLLKLLREFGMTPSSRSGVTRDAETDRDEFDEYLTQGVRRKKNG